MASTDDIAGSTVVGELPGETSVDQHLLNGVLDRLDELKHGSGLDTALAIADCVIESMFKGDLALVALRSRTHQTFRALRTHDRLPIAPNTLAYTLKVRQQHHELPRGLADELSLAQHKALLPVKTVSLKVELGRRALREGMSKRDLERLVKIRCRDDQVRGPGRPRTPAIVKGIRKLEQATQMATGEGVDAKMLRRLDSAGIAELLASLTENLTALQELGDELRKLKDELDD